MRKQPTARVGSLRCLVFGAGGHARVVLDTLLQTGAPTAIIDAASDRWGGEIYDVPIIGDEREIPALIDAGTTHFVVAIGDCSVRSRLYHLCLSHGLLPLTVIHPSSIISSRAEIGLGFQALPSSVVNAGAKIGTNVIVNTGAIVEHDCLIGDDVHVASGATVTGGVRVGEGSFIGAGAVIRPRILVGSHSTIGAGAAVVKDVPSGATVAGVPARRIRSR